MGPGGKGFNQCVAAHKAGANVTMVTKLGTDAFSHVALETMKSLGMDTSHVIITDEYATGTALIMVNEVTGQNAIMVTPSACNHITDTEVDALSGLIAGADILLTQLETNLSAIERVINIAYAMNKTIILNTAPTQPLPDYVLNKVSLVTPNEVEAGIITGIPVIDLASAQQAAEWFLGKGVGGVIITMGKEGAFVAVGDKRKLIPAYEVSAIDTTGAGDAFNGGLVAALAEGMDLFASCQFASATAAISVQRMGTTPSMPTRKEIETFLRKNI